MQGRIANSSDKVPIINIVYRIGATGTPDPDRVNRWDNVELLIDFVVNHNYSIIITVCVHVFGIGNVNSNICHRL